MSGHRAVGVLITTADHQRFFIQRKTADYEPAPGAWSTFGGGMDPGETPGQAAWRELAEELPDVPFDGPLHLLVSADVARELLGFEFTVYRLELGDADFDNLATTTVTEGTGEIVDRADLLDREWVGKLDRAIRHALTRIDD